MVNTSDRIKRPSIKYSDGSPFYLPIKSSWRDQPNSRKVSGLQHHSNWMDVATVGRQACMKLVKLFHIFFLFQWICFTTYPRYCLKPLLTMLKPRSSRQFRDRCLPETWLITTAVTENCTKAHFFPLVMCLVYVAFSHDDGQKTFVAVIFFDRNKINFIYVC